MQKKFLQSLILLLLLVGLPLGSWYYLRTGLDYRLDRLEELASKGKLEGDSFEQGWVYVIAVSDVAFTTLDPIISHFKTNPKLKFTMLDIEQLKKQKILDELWHAAYTSEDISEGVFLTNTSSEIIGVYHLYRERDMAILSEDLAFILPPEPEKDFYIRREQER
ncbi:MAG: hypothetical protein HKN87_11885 [Saprospiraceae bacterium]|nr:hypothetical protein [Saprospiraceae bacterium]